MITIYQDKCTNCSICSSVCPHGVIVMDGQTASLAHTDKCITCGACQLNCPSEAVSVVKKTGCVLTIIKEDILKIKGHKEREERVCPQKKACTS